MRQMSFSPQEAIRDSSTDSPGLLALADGCFRNLQDHRGSGRGDCEQNDGLQSPWAVLRTREPGSCEWCVAEGTVCMSGPFLCRGSSSPGKVKRESVHLAGKRQDWSLPPSVTRGGRGKMQERLPPLHPTAQLVSTRSRAKLPGSQASLCLLRTSHLLSSVSSHVKVNSSHPSEAGCEDLIN